MHNFMHQILQSFRDISDEEIAKKANMVLSMRLTQEMADKLNVTPGWAAEVVGKMEIAVNDDAYNADPELFHDLITETVRIMAAMRKTFAAAHGDSASYLFLQGAAARMSLTYG
jgi:hypothetical protein